MNASISPQAARSSGFTMLELMISMAIFTMLGTMVIFMMTKSLDIFRQGIREASTLDRQDAVLPVIEEDLQALRVVMDAEAPPPVDDDDGLGPMTNPDEMPRRPSVDVRLLSSSVKLKDVGNLKDFPARFLTFVVDISEGLDPTVAGLDTDGGEGALDITPSTVRTRKPDSVFKSTRGLMEVCYIAVPTNPQFPAIMTLYRSYRSPIGDAEHTLFDPENFDTREKILKSFEPVDDGILYFGVTWRRVFAQSWDENVRTRGVGGDLTRYVGPDWDSTRGANPKWAMYAGKDSLTDPSDDVFPAFVRLELVMATPTGFGFGRGDLQLAGTISKSETKIGVMPVDPLVRPGGGRDRWLKIGKEWLRYTTTAIDYQKRTVRVERGGRSTVAETHDDESWIYLGTSTRAEIQLPVFRDRFTLPEGE